MKLFYNKTTIFLICAITAAGLSLSAKTYTLANGKTISNPHVISKRPNGLEIGHDNGIAFIKFELLPAKIQKQYGYSPTAAKKYEVNKAKKKVADANAKKAEEKKKAAFNKKMDKRRLAGSIERLKLDIVKTENRIQFLKTEIPRLQKECDNMLNKTTQMASTSVSGDSGKSYSSGGGGRRGAFGWDGGFAISTGNAAGSRAETTKRKTIAKMEDKYSLSSRNVKKFERELATKEIDVLKMKSKLKRYKKKQ